MMSPQQSGEALAKKPRGRSAVLPLDRMLISTSWHRGLLVPCTKAFLGPLGYHDDLQKTQDISILQRLPLGGLYLYN
jgi:hypothetical protein